MIAFGLLIQATLNLKHYSYQVYQNWIHCQYSAIYQSGAQGVRIKSRPVTVSSLSSGEFVGIVADNPDQIIELKAFHSRIINDHDALKKEKANFLPPPIIQKDSKDEIAATHLLIKQDIQDIVDAMMEEVLNNPEKEGLVVKKNP